MDYRDLIDTGISLAVGKRYLNGRGEIVTIVDKVDLSERYYRDQKGSWYHANGTLGLFEEIIDMNNFAHLEKELDDLSAENATFRDEQQALLALFDEIKNVKQYEKRNYNVPTMYMKADDVLAIIAKVEETV